MATKKHTIITDEAAVEEALTRSVAQVLPSKKALKKIMMSGRRLRVYMGIDPTATYVHIGHATNYLLLKRLHALGHTIIVLMGDFTAMIGDPSDKTAARKRLSKKEVLENLKTFKKQIGTILDFTDTRNPIEFKFNSKWLSKLSFAEVVELSSQFTVQQMVERDVFQRRLKERKPLYVHEFFYPLMQGYDSVALEADVEVGGTDQTFNMLAGRTLVEKLQGREKFVITTTLLENPKTGEKLMSKSRGTGVGLNDPPDEMYAKVMRLPDEGITQSFIDCTELPMDEIKNIKTALEAGGNPRDAKARLAREIVRMYHGERAAQKAEAHFTSVFSKKEIPDDIKEVPAEEGLLLDDVLARHGLAPSKAAARRLAEGGAITNLDTGERITNSKMPIVIPLKLKVGKKYFIRIRVTRRKK